jgi:hypothetical protein
MGEPTGNSILQVSCVLKDAGSVDFSQKRAAQQMAAPYQAQARANS